MSFLVRGDQGPTNIPEGGVPRDMGVTNFSPGLFQAIARAGLEAAGEGSFERTGRRRRGSKNRMAGQADSLRRSIERGLQSGGGEGFLPEPRRTTTTVYSEGRGREIPRPKARDKFVPSKPIRMTKEEYDKMPKRARRKFELPPGSEGIIDPAPKRGRSGNFSIEKQTFRDPRNPRSSGYRDRQEAKIDEYIRKAAEGEGTFKMTKEEAMAKVDERIRKYSSPPPRKATRAEMEERRRNPLGMGQVAEI
jgi:predicted transcriptional regulator